MYVLKSTNDLTKNIWLNDTSTSAKDLPKQYEWLKETVPTFLDIDIWEQVYKQPGNVGVYVAWSPSVEFYIIVHYLFADKYIEKYTDLTKLLNRTHELGIDLPVSRIWIPN